MRTPVDAFVLAKLEAAKLAFAAPAEKRTLIRRVTFDLTGLPPTPDEIDTFLKDNSPDAYEKVVDRLLASPRFGERAALFWLDVARYAESNGFKSDEARPTAWRYRDYVIQSFNADKPYDRFVLEQLAGDELFPDNPAAVIATGFLRHFPYESNAINVEQRRQDYLNDITDATTAAFLGLTVACAKCHDHKTDPITQRDYYRTQAFFAGFQPVEAPLGTAAELAEREKKLKDWEEKTAAVRKQMEAIERPIREKAMAKERFRFPEEYSRLLDVPVEKRTPLERQIAFLVEQQVNGRQKISATQMKGPEREKWEGMAKQMAELSKEKPGDPQTAMVMSDSGPVAPPTHLLKRGDWRKPAAEVPPGFLSEIDDRDADVKPTARGTTGRRAALAKWLVTEDNPLTARVMVNRIWQQLFGRGIVATPSDFGSTGDRPTHPELLDWLARDFQHPAPLPGEKAVPAWSMKHVYRLIVTSAVYRQSGIADHGRKADPDNALLWRMPRKRLDGEALRDAMLAVSGQLNLKAGGPSIYPDLPEELTKSGAYGWKPSADPTDRSRRSVYVAVRRNMRYPLFALFDSPDRNEVCARRFVSTTAPQALTLLNDGLVIGYAKKLAVRVEKDAGTDPDKAIDRAFTLAIGRAPDTEEHAAARGFLDNHSAQPSTAIADLCHALLNLNEFLYVD
ncbi:hypothetical protein FRUB_00458 [Fimbriiglobus ruber]|uniref:Cytochrome c domain-containing protein n=1 Tax=Fimbriiglobus ruber TaxID=1908690 RepID=A0A225EBM6_9BACT|nr:hypothetical protein FRUB_00458 [Fimbriiglobus ruber]